MLHCAATLLAIALLAPLAGLAEGVPHEAQAVALLVVAVGLGSLLQRLLGR